MKQEDIENITLSIMEKLGDENSALISDDIGILLTTNREIFKQINENNTQIEKLKNEKEKLIIANGNLLKQVPIIKEDEQENEKKDLEKKSFSWYESFDEKGNFKK